MNADSFSHGQLTTEMCLNYCRNRGYSIAGTQYSYECFCGNEISPKIKIPDSACNMKCSGDPTQYCGGNCALNIYYL